MLLSLHLRRRWLVSPDGSSQSARVQSLCMMFVIFGRMLRLRWEVLQKTVFTAKVFRAITRFMYKHADWVTTVSPGKVEKIKTM